jgi:serine/threonine protein phosphatase 1
MPKTDDQSPITPHNPTMLSNLAKKFRKPPKPHVTPFVPNNQRIYAVGDIHGRADLLEQLHEKITADASDFNGKKTVVYLGDYIDRGEQSRQVIDILLTRPIKDFEPVYLRGNHEKSLLDFIEYPAVAAAWLSYGGREALNSYGIPLAHIPGRQQIGEIAQRLDDTLPDDHRNFLTISCVDSWQCGSYYFVHAGIRPGIDLEKQSQEDKLWIRDDFLNSTINHGAIIVHGHSITPAPEILPNRIGVDTGAFRTGVLTALVLEGNEQRFLQTG